MMTEELTVAGKVCIPGDEFNVYVNFKADDLLTVNWSELEKEWIAQEPETPNQWLALVSFLQFRILGNKVGAKYAS